MSVAPIVEKIGRRGLVASRVENVTETSLPPTLPRTAHGLSEAEAARLLELRGPQEPAQTSRSYASIVRANVFTVFNLILVVAGVATFDAKALNRERRRYSFKIKSDLVHQRGCLPSKEDIRSAHL